MSEPKSISALGSIVSVPMFGDAPCPARDAATEAGEPVFASDDEHKAAVESWQRRSAIWLRVKIKGRTVVRHASYAREKLEADEKKILRDMRAQDSADDPLRSDLFKPGYMSEAGSDALTAHMRDVLSDLLIGVKGIEIDGADIESESDVAKLVDMLDHLDLLVFAYWACLAANKPRLSQLF